MTKKKVLSISYDESLLRTRHYILEQAGFEVVSAYGFADAMEQCDAHTFDVVLLGHSLPYKDKSAIIHALREECDCPIISLRRHGMTAHPEADYSLDANEGPEALIETLKKAVGLSD